MRSEAELKLLATPEFNAILANDPELKLLSSQKYDQYHEKRVLMEFLNLGDYRIGKLPIRPLTAAKWAFLWLLDSPLVTNSTMSAADLDIVLYCLSVKTLSEIDCSFAQLQENASGYHLAPQLPYRELKQELDSLVRTAFLPLSLLPPSPGTSDRTARFDAHWASRVCSIAAAESGKDFEFCLHQMSLSSVCLFFVARARRESLKPESICHRFPEEVEKLIDRRTGKLAEEFLKGKTNADCM